MANIEQFSAEFFVLDTGIDRFIASLVPIDIVPSPATLDLLTTHTLAHAATIQLYANFKGTEVIQDSKDLIAARSATALIGSINFAESSYVDPILAVRYLQLIIDFAKC